MDNIGNNVKKIRILQGISQKNLAQGICSQSKLSKIENNQILPSITLCYEISKKLNITIDDIFSEYIEESINIQQLLELFYKKDFTECSNLVSALHIENVEKYEQLLMYIKGGCEYHVNSEVDKSLVLLVFVCSIVIFIFTTVLKKINIEMNVDYKKIITSRQTIILYIIGVLLSVIASFLILNVM